MQRTIDAEPDADPGLLGLDVDVARTLADGIGDDEIQQADDGRILLGRVQVVSQILGVRRGDRRSGAAG